jgi:TonB-dependent SusC/RagA subfamily outer membrane receptor
MPRTWLRIRRRHLARSASLAFLALGACRSDPNLKLPVDSAGSVGVGYGKQQEKEITGAVSSLSAEETKNAKANDMADLLEGRFPGVDVRRLPGGGVSVLIRGNRQLRRGGNEEPLYVVDGVPFNATGGAIADLNPRDIKRIEVLKDGSATSVYGSRGANGVILITTNRGSP